LLHDWRFGCFTIGNQKFSIVASLATKIFGHRRLGDKKILIAKPTVIKNF
jgi:hypothetical protein